MKTLHYFLLLFIAIAISFIVFWACVEEFDPEITDYENLLVVEALLTDELEIQNVKLTRSYAYNVISGRVVNTAMVSIEDSKGNTFPFLFIKEGIYNSEKPFKGEVGESYKLKIEVDGKEYASSFCNMLPVQPIDSVYWILNDDDTTNVFVEFYAQINNSLQNHVLFKVEEAWEFTARYKKRGCEDKRVCWASNKRAELKVVSMVNFESDYSKSYQLYTLDDKTVKMAYKYSALVKLFSLSQEMYDFYRLYLDQSEAGGDMFDKVPVSLNSNMFCITNPDEPVLGGFQVSSVSTKRMYLHNNDIKDRLYVDPYMRGCETKGLFLLFSCSDTCVGPSIYVNSISCYDCTATGFPNKPPEYWKYFDKYDE